MAESFLIEFIKTKRNTRQMCCPALQICQMTKFSLRRR